MVVWGAFDDRDLYIIYFFKKRGKMVKNKSSRVLVLQIKIRILNYEI